LSFHPLRDKVPIRKKESTEERAGLVYLEHLGKTSLDVEGGNLGDLGGGGEGGLLGRDQVGGGGEGHLDCFFVGW